MHQAPRRGSLAEALREAVRRLEDAEVQSPHADAELLAAHLLGVGPGAVRASTIRGDAAPDGLADLVAARAAGTPVQHLTGRASFRRLDLHVGPGVFIPRPETELVAGAAIAECGALLAATGAARPDRPDRSAARVIAVDLGSGSGAIAAAVADELPAGVSVYAVEIDGTAAGFARRNLPAWVHLQVADATDPETLRHLDGSVDVVVSNPPYVPDGAVVAADAALDPRVALFGGPTGYELPLAVARRAHTLLRPGGLLVMEHHDDGQPALLDELAVIGFVDVSGHRDLTGRPRYVSARRRHG